MDIRLTGQAHDPGALRRSDARQHDQRRPQDRRLEPLPEQDDGVGAGRPYYASEPPGPRLRLSFSAADDVQASAGVRRLAEVVTGSAQ